MNVQSQPEKTDARPTNWALITGGVAMFVAAVVIMIYPQSPDGLKNFTAQSTPAVQTATPSSF